MAQMEPDTPGKANQASLNSEKSWSWPTVSMSAIDSMCTETVDGECPFGFSGSMNFEEKVIHALRVMYLDIIDLAESVAESVLGDVESDDE